MERTFHYTNVRGEFLTVRHGHYSAAMTSHSSSLSPSVAFSDVVRWAAAGEREDVEFKATTSQREEAAKTLCGMLNGHGGIVLFGVDDDGAIRGQQVSEKTLEQIAAVMARIEPPINPHIERVELDSKLDVIAIRVPEGEIKPYMYRGSAWRRVGATTQKMTWDEYQRSVLERAHPARRWETEPSVLAVTDLELDEFMATVQEGVSIGRWPSMSLHDPAGLLRQLDLLVDDRPTNGAVALFGDPGKLASPYPQCSAAVRPV